VGPAARGRAPAARPRSWPSRGRRAAAFRHGRQLLVKRTGMRRCIAGRAARRAAGAGRRASTPARRRRVPPPPTCSCGAVAMRQSWLRRTDCSTRAMRVWARTGGAGWERSVCVATALLVSAYSWRRPRARAMPQRTLVAPPLYTRLTGSAPAACQRQERSSSIRELLFSSPPLGPSRRPRTHLFTRQRVNSYPQRQRSPATACCGNGDRGCPRALCAPQ